MKWQPIETAPKDEWILVCDEDRMQYVAIWCPDSRCGDYFRYGPREDYFGGLIGTIWKPTHWQPLPVPPELY